MALLFRGLYGLLSHTKSLLAWGSLGLNHSDYVIEKLGGDTTFIA